jgi:hypothetical protein
MITRFHGIDRHNKYSTISILNRKGEEIDFKVIFPKVKKIDIWKKHGYVMI